MIKDNNAYMILVGVTIFAFILILINMTIYGFEGTFEQFSEQYQMEDDEAPIWDFPAWFGDRLEESQAINLLTLNIPLLNEAGALGDGIKVVTGIFIAIGLVDILWLG